MPCEQYKDALIEAAATGSDFASAADLSPELAALRAHLAACAACLAAFAEEQSLFAAIDSSLHAAANGDVPPSILPRVRASLDSAVVSDPRWVMLWPVLPATAVVVAVLFVVTILRHTDARRGPEDSIANTSSAPKTIQVPSNVTSSARSNQADAATLPTLSPAKSVGPHELANRHSAPEVLVPRDQEFLLAAYARQWGARQRAPLLPADADLATVTPLEVAPIQITQLDVKLLTEDGSK